MSPILWKTDIPGGATLVQISLKPNFWGSPGDSVVKNPPAGEGDLCAIIGLGVPHMLRSNQACSPQLLTYMSQILRPKHLRAQAPCRKRSHYNEKTTATARE